MTRRNIFLFILSFFVSVLLFSEKELSLRVGVYENYPKVYIDAAGNVKGIFPDLLQEIANNNNWKLQYISGYWDEGLQRLRNGEIDIMVDVAFSEERKDEFDFHQESVFASWGCLYTKGRIEINSVLDLDGITVAVMRKSILTDGEDGIYNLVKRYEVSCEFLEVDDYHQVFELVESGRADAGVVNRTFGIAFAEDYGLKQASFIFLPSQLYYAFPKNAKLNPILIRAIDTKLAEWKKNLDSHYYQVMSLYKMYPAKPMSNVFIIILIALMAIVLFLVTLFLLTRWQVKRQTRLLEESNKTLKDEILSHQQTLKLLEQSEEKYRSFVDNIPGLIFMYEIDPKGNRIPLLQSNRVTEFLGSSFSREIDLDINNFFANILPEDMKKLQEKSDLAEKDQRALDVEYRVKLDDNVVKWFRSIGRVSLLKNGNRRWQGVILDIDDRKQMERKLDLYRKHLEDLVESRTHDLKIKASELEAANRKLKEADELKSIFLASMSHELRTPLNSIIGFTGILLMGMVGELTNEQKKQLEIIKNSSNHLLDLINDILDISKIEAGKAEISLSRFSVSDLATEIVQSLQPKAAEKGLKMISEVENIEMVSDYRRLKQIIINLLSNAIKFTAEGEVKISIKNTNNEKVNIVVQDSGCGISSEDIKRLFEPFQQLDRSLTKKQDGTGLGLHLTKKILTMLKGDIEVESEIGKGSSFKVNIPVILEER
jgi:signal transduction histidine kinase/ABC-type amino acid transport substrate-binding protein